jgi:hypothetical protein
MAESQKQELQPPKKKEEDYMQLLQRAVDLNELTAETIRYLYRDDLSLFEKKDIPFIKDTLLKLGAGGLLQIQT